MSYSILNIKIKCIQLLFPEDKYDLTGTKQNILSHLSPQKTFLYPPYSESYHTIVQATDSVGVVIGL